MKNFRRTLFFLCGLALVARAAAAAPSIMIFGDSLTDGNALGTDGRKLVWVAVAQREAGDTLLLINEGRGGRQTNSVPQFEQAILRHPRVDAVAIMLGTNDSRDISGQCVSKAVGFITEMVARARAAYGPDVRLLLIGPPNIRKDALVASKPIANERDANLRALGEAYRELAAKLGTEFTPAYGLVPEESLKNDGVHPDPAGNVALGCGLLPALKKLVSR